MVSPARTAMDRSLVRSRGESVKGGNPPFHKNDDSNRNSPPPRMPSPLRPTPLPRPVAGVAILGAKRRADRGRGAPPPLPPPRPPRAPTGAPSPPSPKITRRQKTLTGANPQGSFPAQPGGKCERGESPLSQKRRLESQLAAAPHAPTPPTNPAPTDRGGSCDSRREAPSGPGTGRSAHRSHLPDLQNTHRAPRPRSARLNARCRSRDLNPDTREEYCALNAARLPFRHFGAR